MALVDTETPWVPNDTFGARLMLLRKQLGLSQEEAADLCGLKASTWFTWENGAKPRGQAEVVNKIASATGCDRNWLMWGGFLTSCDYGASGSDELDNSLQTQLFVPDLAVAGRSAA